MPARDQSAALRQLIFQHAVELANVLRDKVAQGANEEEIRIETERHLAFLERAAEVKLAAHHEFTVASGRIDSVYQRVIIEYKNPSSAARIGATLDAPGTKKLVDQIKRRFADIKTDQRQPVNTLFGVGLDGNRFIFVKYIADKWHVQGPLPVDRYTAERFLWVLFNLGSSGKPFAPDLLADDFGASSNVAQVGVKAFYEALLPSTDPKVRVLFSQWRILFGEVCGYEVDAASEKIAELADSYGILRKGVRPAELLFALHSYYALFMKLLASELVVFRHLDIPTPLKRVLNASTSKKLLHELEDLEAGSIFRHLKITNFLEGDLFSWYLSAWTEPVEKTVRALAAQLDHYNPDTLAEDPGGSRDLLKKLYQGLFPKSVRHDLGEYYTPDWLAEHVLEKLDFDGDPDVRVLDPACGSGTFLVMAINRIRRRFDDNRENTQLDEGALCTRILKNVVGFDLNPIAVMAARTNFLIAIRDLIGRVDHVEIPVYLCDSILTPSEYGDLFSGSMGDTKRIRTAVGDFLIPTDITSSQQQVASYADLLEQSIKVKRSRNEFLQHCEDEGLVLRNKRLHGELYDILRKLDAEKRNGIWTRIIKNAFAPLFAGRFDVIAGNPPWVRWGFLPPAYRQDTQHLWRYYGLFTKKGLESRMGTAELDLSMLFTYVAADAFLREKGRLGFVITKEVFKSKGAGEGFRRFEAADINLHLRPYRVDDMSALKPFQAANKTSCLFLTKGQDAKYPVPYFVWSKKGKPVTPEADFTTEEAATYLAAKKQQASPIGESGSPWQTTAATSLPAFNKLKGESAYRARIGARVEPYGVYWLRVLDARDGQSVLVENLPELGKSDIDKKPPTVIETDHLFPALRGKDISRWGYRQELWTLVPTRGTKREDWVDEVDMKRHAPKTYAYLEWFREPLLARSNYWKFFARREESKTPLKSIPGKVYVRKVAGQRGAAVYEVADAPFYTLFNVGPYTFAAFRVCWSRMTNAIKACVVSDEETAFGRKQVIVTDTTTLVPFETDAEAHYFCAIINSGPVGQYIQSFSASGRGFGSAAILERIQIPRFDPKNKLHVRLSALSLRGHQNAVSGAASLSALDIQVNQAVAELWGLTAEEVAGLPTEPEKAKRNSKVIEAKA